MRAKSSLERLTHFVSKNTNIPVGIKRVLADRKEELDLFKGKIIDHSISINDTVFEDPDCELYVLSLLKINEISDMQAYSLLDYLQILRQYTDKQAVKPEDEDNFKHKNIPFREVTKFSEIKKIARILSQQLNEVGCVTSSEELLTAYCELKGCEKWIFFIDILNLESNLAHELQTFPWVVSLNDHGQYYHLSPTLNVMMCQLFNPNCPVDVQPILGTISGMTLTRMIQTDRLRPLTFYSPLVKSNPAKQHNSTIGPVTFTEHDFYHLFSMFILLPRDAYKLFFLRLEPSFKEIFDLKTAKSLSENLGDLNMTSSVEGKTGKRGYFIDNEILTVGFLIKYLHTTLFWNPNENSFSVFFKLYKHFLGAQERFSAVEGKTIPELLCYIVQHYFPKAFSLSYAVIESFLEKLYLSTSKNRSPSDQATEDTQKNEDQLEESITFALKLNDASSIGTVSEEVKKQSNAMTRKYYSLFATERQPYGPYSDTFCYSGRNDSEMDSIIQFIKSFN